MYFGDILCADHLSVPGLFHTSRLRLLEVGLGLDETMQHRHFTKIAKVT